MTEERFEVISLGRVGVDLYPAQSGVPLAEVTSFNKYLGGSATNVAVAAARYGRRSAVVTKVGDDGFGPYVRKALQEFGVDTRWVSTDPHYRTPIVFCEIYPPDDFPLLFYRDPKAPDMNLSVDDLDLTAIAAAEIVWTTGTGLSDEPSRTATLAALDEHRGAGSSDRGGRRHTIHDLDYRAMFWRSVDEARRQQLRALEYATVAIGNREEIAVAVGEGGPEQHAQRLLDLGVQIAIVKMGPAGVLVATADGVERVPPVPIEVVNGLGAGDAFGGAVCHGLLSAWSPDETVAFANAAGAYVAGQLACADAMPTEEQVRALMASAAV